MITTPNPQLSCSQGWQAATAAAVRVRIVSELAVVGRDTYTTDMNVTSRREGKVGPTRLRWCTTIGLAGRRQR